MIVASLETALASVEQGSDGTDARDHCWSGTVAARLAAALRAAHDLVQLESQLQASRTDVATHLARHEALMDRLASAGGEGGRTPDRVDMEDWSRRRTEVCAEIQSWLGSVARVTARRNQKLAELDMALGTLVAEMHDARRNSP
jgi:hypothetical protein